ncbi:MAG: aspartate aminotransferase family protein [Methanomassiliicoccales archaeon]|jgi:acetylornithine aminotransferase/acetylornithine/N-succinyldiaminopimelate aminotransferase|nr:aspartate aminotransferase family protein [Methanomassiliicoccales archaeon]
MKFEEIKKLSNTYLFSNYSREEVCFERGHGEFLYDLDGNEYLDLVAGIAVNILGHCHPAITKAVKEQVDRLVHVSNLYYIKEQAQLAQTLATIMPEPLNRSMFVNSGAEANEAALKLAAKKTKRRRFVATYNSFHGRTIGALSATGQRKYHEGFEPLLSNSFDFINYGDVEALKTAITSDTAAVILEPMQGEGGIVVPPAEFMKTARDLCTERDTLLILDEVQTGLGRTGKMFAFEHFNIVPDIVTLAKGLGGGFPIGAIISSEEVANAFQPGSHGSTFGGNPFVCRVATTVIETLKNEKLDSRAMEIGDAWISRIKSLCNDFPFVVRGKGLMIGLEMGEEAKQFQKFCFKHRILVNVCAGKVVRMVPALIISEDSISRFDQVLRSYIDLRASAGSSISEL